MKYIRNKYRGWWMEYNYITSAGLDTGLAICAIILFFCVQLPTDKPMTSWWGTNVLNTVDILWANNTQKIVNVTAGETFGPRPGTWKW